MLMSKGMAVVGAYEKEIDAEIRYLALLSALGMTEQEANAIIRYNTLISTLTAIKGVGWTTETLKAIKDAIDALPPGISVADIWSYATRKLTNLSDTRAGYIDLLADGTIGLSILKTLIDAIPITPELEASALARYNIIKTTEVEISQAPATENAAVTIAVITADQSLGAKNITVNVPTGATITRVIALARISIMNDSATAQKIDLKFEIEGIALFSQTDVIGFGAVDGTSGCYIIAEDATDEVTADGQIVTLEAKVTLSSANAVRFQAQYYLFITYRMG